MSEAEFWDDANIIINRKRNLRDYSTAISLRQYRHIFGTTPTICSILWGKIKDRNTLPPYARPLHLLCALLFLKVYSTEEVHAALTGLNEKTFRKWSWKFINLIASLDSEVVTIPYCY